LQVESAKVGNISSVQKTEIIKETDQPTDEIFKTEEDQAIPVENQPTDVATTAKPSNSKKLRICNCKKTKCLKLYCDCFAAGEFCGVECNCTECSNAEAHSS